MTELLPGQVIIQNDTNGKQTPVSEAVYKKSIESKTSPFHGWSIVPCKTESDESEVKPARKSKKQE
jgi:hypothetical protein